MIEQVLKDIRDAIKDNIAAELTAVEALFTGAEAISLVAPKTYFLGERSDALLKAQEYPLVIVEPARSEETYWTTPKEDQEHLVGVLLAVIDDEVERLGKRVWRTMRAIEVALEKKVRTNGRVIGMRGLAITWGGVEAAGSAFRKAAMLEARFVEREDSYFGT